MNCTAAVASAGKPGHENEPITLQRLYDVGSYCFVLPAWFSSARQGQRADRVSLLLLLLLSSSSSLLLVVVAVMLQH